jgi:hypothetical protein
MSKPAALYARVSSDRQKENHTIASQVAALLQYAETHGYAVPLEWQFQDDGYSGATLVRPGLEALRDLAAEGYLQTVLVYAPDRLSRKYVLSGAPYGYRYVNQFPPLGLIQGAALHPGMEHMQLGFAHRPLEAQQQPVVEVGGIVDAALVQDQRVGERTDLQQTMPVGGVAGQA